MDRCIPAGVGRTMERAADPELDTLVPAMSEAGEAEELAPAALWERGAGDVMELLAVLAVAMRGLLVGSMCELPWRPSTSRDDIEPDAILGGANRPLCRSCPDKLVDSCRVNVAADHGTTSTGAGPDFNSSKSAVKVRRSPACAVALPALYNDGTAMTGPAVEIGAGAPLGSE